MDNQGRCYTIGDNSHFQVCPEPDKVGGGVGDFNASHLNSPGPARSDKSGNNSGLVSPVNAKVEKTGSYYDTLQRVNFIDSESRSIYKVHAFKNTSIAIDRNSEMLLWGENTISTANNKLGKNFMYPTVITEFFGIDLCKQRKLC